MSGKIVWKAKITPCLLELIASLYSMAATELRSVVLEFVVFKFFAASFKYSCVSTLTLTLSLLYGSTLLSLRNYQDNLLEKKCFFREINFSVKFTVGQKIEKSPFQVFRKSINYFRYKVCNLPGGSKTVFRIFFELAVTEKSHFKSQKSSILLVISGKFGPM